MPEILDPSVLDAKYLVSNRDAVAALRDLVAREGIFAGPSCGAVLVAAAREAQRMERGTIVALLPDGGWKYLSAGTFERDLDEMEDDLEGGVQLVVSRAEASLAPGAGDRPPPARAWPRRSSPRRAPSTRNEACGIIAGTADAADGGTALRYVACRNESASPYRYAIHPDDAVPGHGRDRRRGRGRLGRSSTRTCGRPRCRRRPTSGCRVLPGRAVPPRVARATRRTRPASRRCGRGGSSGRRHLRGGAGGRMSVRRPAPPSVDRGRVAWLLAGRRRARRRHAAGLERHAARGDRHAAGPRPCARSSAPAVVVGGCGCIIQAVRRLEAGTRHAVRAS